MKRPFGLDEVKLGRNVDTHVSKIVFFCLLQTDVMEILNGQLQKLRGRIRNVKMTYEYKRAPYYMGLEP